MRVVVEVIGRENVADFIRCRIVEQQSTQHRLLRIDRLRRNFERFGLCIVRHRRESRNRLAILTGSANKKGPLTVPFRLFARRTTLHASGIAEHGNSDVRRNVGMQHDCHREVSDVLQRSFRHANHRLFDGMPLRL